MTNNNTGDISRDFALSFILALLSYKSSNSTVLLPWRLNMTVNSNTDVISRDFLRAQEAFFFTMPITLLARKGLLFYLSHP